jgi:hypothetical protein
MSGDWQRLLRVRGVSSGSPENHWVPCLIHKARTEDGGAEALGRSDRCATTASGGFKAENTRRDRKAFVEAKQDCGRRASVRWCYDKVSQTALRGRVS